MRLLYLFLLLQSAIGHRYAATGLVHEERKLNSGARLGGTSRLLVRVVVPAHTDAICYAVSASPRNPLQDIGLLMHLKEMVKAGSVHLSLSTAVLNDITQPSADGVADVLVMTDSTEAAKYVLKKGPGAALEDYSRRNVSNALMYIPITYSKTATVLYITLRNPSAYEAQFVTLEVDAFIRQ